MAAISFGSEYTITSDAPGLVGKASYSVDASGNVSMTVSMRCASNGSWANDPWCAWVNGTKQQVKARTSGTIGKKWYSTTYSLGKTYSGTIKWSRYNNGSGTTQYTWSIPTPTWNVIVRINNMDAYGNYTGAWVWKNENVARGGSVSWTAYSGDSIYNDASYSNSNVTGNVDTTLNVSRKTGSFNLNILMPDDSEPYSTGRAGKVQMSTDGGSSWSDYIINEPASSYYRGRPLKFRNFVPGEGLYLASANGVDSNWAVTQDDAVTVDFHTEYDSYYLDVNGLLDGTSSGGLGNYGRVNVVVNGSTVGNQVSDYYTEHRYDYSYSITNITPLPGYRYNGLASGSSAASGTIGLGKTVILNFSTIEPSNLQIGGQATTPFNIDLNWSSEGINITNYTIYYNGVAKDCGTSTATSISVMPETTYDIYFTATNAGGTTTSGTISITTPADQAKMRIRTKAENEHPVFEGYTPVQYITATALNQRIELDHDRFHDYEVVLKLKWNDITTEQNIGSYQGGYFGVSNGYYTSKGKQTTMPAVVGREDVVRLVSEFLYDLNEGVEPGPNFIYGGSVHYQVTLYVNDNPIDSYETTSSSSMPSYSYFHLFGVYGIDNGSTASIYSYSDPYMTLLPYAAADGTPVFISQDGEVYRFDGDSGKVGAGFGEWLRGKVYYKKDGRWIKAKRIYQKTDEGWKMGTNVEPGDLTFWKQSHSGIWTINYNYKTGLSDVTCNGQSGWWEHLYKIYSTEPGATYTVEFDYYNPKGYSPDYGGIECQASNVLENNNGDERKIGYVLLESTASPSVQHLSFTFTATQTETCIGFNFGRGSDASPVNIHIGNIFVRKN